MAAKECFEDDSMDTIHQNSLDDVAKYQEDAKRF